MCCSYSSEKKIPFENKTKTPEDIAFIDKLHNELKDVKTLTAISNYSGNGRKVDLDNALLYNLSINSKILKDCKELTLYRKSSSKKYKYKYKYKYSINKKHSIKPNKTFLLSAEVELNNNKWSASYFYKLFEKNISYESSIDLNKHYGIEVEYNHSKSIREEGFIKPLIDGFMVALLEKSNGIKHGKRFSPRDDIIDYFYIKKIENNSPNNYLTLKFYELK